MGRLLSRLVRKPSRSWNFFKILKELLANGVRKKSSNGTVVLFAKKEICVLKNYKIGFDVWALVLFLFVMIPNIIWLAIPAPNDILRVDSVTKTIDSIASVSQALMIAILCIIKNSESKKLSVTPLIAGTVICCLLYYVSWLAYYQGIAGTIVILALTVLPCSAFLLYAIDRRNRIAIIPIAFFTICHLIYAFANFII